MKRGNKSKRKLIDPERLDVSPYTPNPAAKLIPAMREEEFEDLKADIKADGLH